MTGVAIIGTGDIAGYHIAAYQALAGRCEVRAVVDIFPGKARIKADKYGLACDAVADYHDLLERDDIQLVSVCLPPALHCQVSVDFLLAGKHVLCEKPMAPTLEECDAMLAAEKKGGARLSIVAQNRFKPDVMKTKALLDTGALGELLFAQANSLWWRGARYYDLWWRGTWEKEGGGCTFIHAVHHIDLLLWLMGSALEVRSVHRGGAGGGTHLCADRTTGEGAQECGRRHDALGRPRPVGQPACQRHLLLPSRSEGEAARRLDRRDAEPTLCPSAEAGDFAVALFARSWGASPARGRFLYWRHGIA